MFLYAKCNWFFLSVIVILHTVNKIEMVHITNIMEYEDLAKQKLPKMVYDFYASGAEDQWTPQENRNAFSRIM